MAEISIRDLMSKLDYVQHSVWTTEEIILKYSGSVAKQQKDVEEIKSTLDLINEKLNKLDKEISGLRNNSEE